jgi:hypothetical protein
MMVQSANLCQERVLKFFNPKHCSQVLRSHTVQQTAGIRYQKQGGNTSTMHAS